MRKPGEGIRCAYFREENREVKHRGVRFREQREGCRGPQGRSWNSGSGTGGPVQAAGRRESQWEAESGTAGRGPPREGRETRKAVGAGSGADNLSNPLWDELGHALPGPGTPACEARPRFLPLPARGGGGGAGLGTPASAAGLVRLPGRLRLGRTPPGPLAAGGAVVPRARPRSLPGHWEPRAASRAKPLDSPHPRPSPRRSFSRATVDSSPRARVGRSCGGRGRTTWRGRASGGRRDPRPRGEPQGGVGRSREEPQWGVGRNLAPAPTRAVVTCSPREPGRTRGEARSQLGLPLCARGTAGKAPRSRVFLAGGPALSPSLVRTAAICFQAEEKMSKTQTEGSVNPGPGMQGLLERQPMRSRPWDSTWPARPFPCSVDSVKPDLSSAYSVEVEAD
ncbi:uncharacterized protein [Chlorocebus sabaeus]|uniref:uncharacterized protein n=1 Tax=Chlorocebus sabaeus TaxID=60711 RepID=UPI003BF9782D